MRAFFKEMPDVGKLQFQTLQNTSAFQNSLHELCLEVIRRMEQVSANNLTTKVVSIHNVHEEKKRKFNGECYYCGKSSHKKQDCYSVKKSGSHLTNVKKFRFGKRSDQHDSKPNTKMPPKKSLRRNLPTPMTVSK